MPARTWAEFLDVYYRPHLIVVYLPTSTESDAGRQLVGLLRQLIQSLGSTADYAFLPEGDEVKIAFERAIDFEVARGLLKGTLLEVSHAEWASRAICSWEP